MAADIALHKIPNTDALYDVMKNNIWQGKIRVDWRNHSFNVLRGYIFPDDKPAILAQLFAR